MSEQQTTSNPTSDPAEQPSNGNAEDEKVLLTRGQVKRAGAAASAAVSTIAAPAVTLLGYGLIIGLALTGLAAMGVSSVVWLFSHAGWFCGFGLLTGGLFLAASTALFLGKLSRAERALYQHRRRVTAS